MEFFLVLTQTGCASTWENKEVTVKLEMLSMLRKMNMMSW